MRKYIICAGCGTRVYYEAAQCTECKLLYCMVCGKRHFVDGKCAFCAHTSRMVEILSQRFADKIKKEGVDR